MPTRGLQARSALESIVAKRHGRPDGHSGVVLAEVTGRGLVTVIARKGQAGRLRETVAATFGLDLPDAPKLVRGNKVSFYWAGFQQWTASADEADVPRLLFTLREELGGLASLSDQSDARAMILTSGPAARAALAKVVPVDLHPRAFARGDTALTLIGQVSGQVTLTEFAPIFELSVARGFAKTVWHGLLAAGAEFGVDVVAAR